MTTTLAFILDPELLPRLLRDPRTRKQTQAHLRAWLEATEERVPVSEVIRRAEAAWYAAAAEQRVGAGGSGHA
jgi:hypothetical protein